MRWNGEFPLSWQFHVLITVFVMLTADWQADYWALSTKPRHESDGDGSSPWWPHFVNKRWLLVKWNTDIQRYSPSLSMFAIVYNSEHLSWAQFKQNKENTKCKILVKLTSHSPQHSHKACFRGNKEPPTLQCNWLTRPKMYIFTFFINPISFFMEYNWMIILHSLFANSASVPYNFMVIMCTWHVQ